MTPFRLDQHPRRGSQPLSVPPAGYFEQLPTRVMAQVAAPARRPLLPDWLRQAPAYVRTGLASALLLGTFAASLWLGGGAAPRAATAASLDGVPQEELLDYLASDARLDMTDLAELPARPLGITTHYLHPSAPELTDALDAQPIDEAALL
ncbi:hypothetical protein [Hymenobacter bucti]|uniref:Uncharacterized protein n=1 Tax=Hymenobacter bucti TaxID=1844114 RepID=A0ABW4R0V1_9BACT